ncbi:hypothetical protein [Erwinia amylovora]|uniref:hypothetical protein n=1 Tax=Erwinia amylovora TaxID=552 RepID=UPI0013E36C17|nr:hypothetical protein [Erwinia amylovora]
MVCPCKKIPPRRRARVAGLARHPRPPHYRDIADAETEAIPAALLEKYPAQ